MLTLLVRAYVCNLLLIRVCVFGSVLGLTHGFLCVAARVFVCAFACERVCEIVASFTQCCVLHTQVLTLVLSYEQKFVSNFELLGYLTHQQHYSAVDSERSVYLCMSAFAHHPIRITNTSVDRNA